MAGARFLSHYAERTFASLRIRNYRLYFFGQGISMAGTWMQTLAQAWLVLRLTGSGTDLGLLAAAQFLPMLVLGAWGGVVVDRVPKRTILMLTQTLAAVLALALGILVYLELVQIWMVYGMAIALGVVNVFDNPARQIFVTEMVGEENLSNAVTLNATEVNLARMVGPALGGAVIAGLGLAQCFFLNSLSYLAVLAMLFLIDGRELRESPRVKREPGQLKEGIRYAGSEPVLLAAIVMMAIIGTLTMEYSVILPLYATSVFSGTAGTYAALTAALSLGSVIAGLVTAGHAVPRPRVLLFVAASLGLFCLVAAMVPNFLVVLAALVGIGYCSMRFTTLGNVILQLVAKPEMRGRIMALWMVAFLGSTPVGAPIIGWIGEHASPQWGMGIGGLSALVAVFVGSLLLARQTNQVSSEDLLPA